jgi:hypothetical protein
MVKNCSGQFFARIVPPERHKRMERKYLSDLVRNWPPELSGNDANAALAAALADAPRAGARAPDCAKGPPIRAEIAACAILPESGQASATENDRQGKNRKVAGTEKS